MMKVEPQNAALLAASGTDAPALPAVAWTAEIGSSSRRRLSRSGATDVTRYRRRSRCKPQQGDNQ
jgi:hypothetical protein